MKKCYWMCFAKAILFLALPWLLNLYYEALARAPHFSIPPLVSDIGLGIIALLVALAAFLFHSGWITDLVIFIGSVGWILAQFELASWLASSEVFICPFVLAGVFLASAVVKGARSFKRKRAVKAAE